MKRSKNASTIDSWIFTAVWFVVAALSAGEARAQNGACWMGDGSCADTDQSACCETDGSCTEGSPDAYANLIPVLVEAIKEMRDDSECKLAERKRELQARADQIAQHEAQNAALAARLKRVEQMLSVRHEGEADPGLTRPPF